MHYADRNVVRPRDRRDTTLLTAIRNVTEAHASNHDEGICHARLLELLPLKFAVPQRSLQVFKQMQWSRVRILQLLNERGALALKGVNRRLGGWVKALDSDYVKR